MKKTKNSRTAQGAGAAKEKEVLNPKKEATIGNDAPMERQEPILSDRRFKIVIAELLGRCKEYQGVNGIMEPKFFGDLKKEWIPQTNPDRQCIKADVLEEPSLLRVRRNSLNAVDVLSITKRDFEDCFGYELTTAHNGQQATIVLVDGTLLLGYVVSTKDGVRLFLPKPHLPKGLTAPPNGFRQYVIAIGYILS